MIPILTISVVALLLAFTFAMIQLEGIENRLAALEQRRDEDQP